MQEKLEGRQGQILFLNFRIIPLPMLHLFTGFCDFQRSILQHLDDRKTAVLIYLHLDPSPAGGE